MYKDLLELLFVKSVTEGNLNETVSYSMHLILSCDRDIEFCPISMYAKL